VLAGRGLCDELISRPEESYRLCCVVVCGLETARMGAPYIYIYIYDISRLRVKYSGLRFVFKGLIYTWNKVLRELPPEVFQKFPPPPFIETGSSFSSSSLGVTSSIFERFGLLNI